MNQAMTSIFPAAAMALAGIGQGFAAPAQGAQQVFRALLQAMSYPGRIQTLPAVQPGELYAPGCSPAACGVLLTLLDAETRLHLMSPDPGGSLATYLRFHTGTRLIDRADEAGFVLAQADQLSPWIWQTLCSGSDEAPHESATLIVEVPTLGETSADAMRLELQGPGIRESQTLQVSGLGAAFWQARLERQADYPRGIDLILCCGHRLAALPRTTRVRLPD